MFWYSVFKSQKGQTRLSYRVRLTLVYCVRLFRERKRSFRGKGKKKKRFFSSEWPVVALRTFLKQQGLFLPTASLPYIVELKTLMLILLVSVINKKLFNFFGKVLQLKQIRSRGKVK